MKLHIEKGKAAGYRGNGEPLIGFCPYFLHEYSSGGISAIFELMAGTLITFFTLFFLRFEQWHLLLPEPDILPETLSEWSCSWHLFLNGVDDSGGFPVETASAGAKNRDDPCFPFETLPSPVIAEDINEELEETLKLSFVNSNSVLLVLELNKQGFVKSRVKLWGCEGTKLTGAVLGASTGAGFTVSGGVSTGAGVRVRALWESVTVREAADDDDEEKEED